MVIGHCDHLNFKVKFRFLMFCRGLQAAFRRVRVYFDFICAPSLEYHHHLYTLCNQRSVMRFFCAVIYSRSVAVQSKPCGTLAPVYGVNLAQGRTDPSKRLLLSSYFKGRKAKCQPEDRHLQKLAAPTNYVSKTETPSTHAH